MPTITGQRVRSNNAYGVTTDNPLTAGAITFNSTQLTLLPNIAIGQHAIVVLDPKRVFGQPEIVIVTAHTGLSTVATITRGAYGTVAASHAVGTAWAHVGVAEDYMQVLSSTTRPGDPYMGQAIYETDTLSYKYYNGTVWNSDPPIGTILAYAGASAPTGYLLANGAAVTRTGVTADLFALIGTTYGSGDGSTTYNLPSLLGRIPVGRDAAQSEFDVLGETGGLKTVQLTAATMPSHVHGITDMTHLHGQTTHDHSTFNPPKIGTNGTHYHDVSTTLTNITHNHQSTQNGGSVMVIQTGAGPFNVAAPGATDFVTFDSGHTTLTGTSSIDHNHGVNNEVVGAIMQPVVANLQFQATGITGTNSTGSDGFHQNLQPYIAINYIIKI